MPSTWLTLPSFLLAFVLSPGFFPAPAPAAEPDAYSVGVAKIDITPSYPVRLSGFGNRRTESEEIGQRIWAKALAIDDGEPALIVTVDNLGVPADLVQEVAARLAKKANVKPQRLAITATHTHTAPMLKGVCPTLFGQPIPKDHQERIDRYTAELIDNLEKVALAALAERQPARLTWGVGQVGFAVNRRTKGGPVDHDLPLLVVRDQKGKVRALYLSYACHCVTLSYNKIGGDWAGYAQELIQDDHPGAIVLVSVGCGADANPSSGVTGGKEEIASRQGAEVAREVKRLWGGYLAPVTGKLSAVSRRLELPLSDLPTREQWEEKAKKDKAIAVGYHARVQLARLDQGLALRTKIAYPVQTWAFGDSLAMVFLPGEVVVDYSLRLKRELDGRRLWVNAYANDAPCYIPSERVLKEGGYEGGRAMVFYDVPAPFKPGLEKLIVEAVREPLDQRFTPPFDYQRTGGAPPLSPQQSLATIRTKKGLTVELMAAEPLIASPVAIDFGPDGRLWVAEMADYPMGLDGKYRPGGRVRVLESTQGDGKYDKSTVFLDNIPFPTGLTVWRKGILICAAPDILYAEDTDGHGKAGPVRKLFSGFGTENYQARVNSLHYGLDGWVYGSCGLFGGTIRGFPQQTTPSPLGGEGRVRGDSPGEKGSESVKLGNRDFRIKPDTGILEPATGRSQQGRVRDDWDNWFGCTNGSFCQHYPLADHYLRRNPHLIVPAATVPVNDYPNPNRLYPVSQQLQLFKHSGPPGLTTSACGLGIYRDDLLGEEYRGDAFTCEPVNLIVHRLRLSPRGSTFSGRRAADETASEFLGATDNWFRPVQVQTGPDGCLWIVDMYRYVIEHPRFIPPEDLAKLDVRAGSAMGRIYRIRPSERDPRPFTRLDQMETAGLVTALDSPNGWQRDMAGQMLLWRDDKAATKPLEQMALSNPRAEARLHALCLLDGLAQLQAPAVLQTLADKHPGVRRHAVRLSEKFLAASPDLGAALVKLGDDADAQVRLQLASSLGEWRDARAGRALVTLALRQGDDPFLAAAVLSSVRGDNLADFLSGVFASSAAAPPPQPLVEQLMVTVSSQGDKKTLSQVIRDVAAPRQGRLAPWQMAAVTGVLDSQERRKETLDQLLDEPARAQVKHVLTQAQKTAADDKASDPERIASVHLLGRVPDQRPADLDLFRKLLVPHNSPALQAAAVTALGRMPEDRVAVVLTESWKNFTPALKSHVLDLLLSRGSWQRHLLASVEKNVVPAANIDARCRQRLLKDKKLHDLAAKLFTGTNPDRQKVIDAYRAAASMAGDGVRGKAVFAKSCAVCHQLQELGHAVGPDLAALSNKTPLYLLTEILDPNRNVDSRYVEYVAVTKEGRTFTGILASETTTSITLMAQEGKEQVLLRNDLEEFQSTGKSLMPEGLEKDISPKDLADLIAYLTASGPPAKPPGPPKDK